MCYEEDLSATTVGVSIGTDGKSVVCGSPTLSDNFPLSFQK